MLRRSAFPLLLLNMFLANLSMGLVIPIVPELLEMFSAGGQAAGYLVSCFGLTQFLFSPFAGNLSDRYGRKPMIITGLILFALSNLLAAFAGDLTLLFVSRLVGGIGSAALVPAIIAYVADITEDARRSKAMSWLGASMTSGFIIGPGVGGLLAEWGIKMPFFASASVGLLAMICSMWMLPEPLSPDIRRLRQSVQDKKDHIFRQIGLSVRSRYFILLLIVFAMTFGLTHFEAIFPLFVVQGYGFTTQQIALLLTVCSLIGTLNQVLLTDWITRRFGEKRVIVAMLLLSALTLASLLFSGNYYYVMIITMLFFSFNNILRPTINTLLSKEAGEEQGFVAGMNNAYTSLGTIFGPLLAGILYEIHIDLPYLFGAFVLLASSFVSVRKLNKNSSSASTDPLTRSINP
ncbi:DHA1 family multidrug resistance protein-like MFS transporter [Paenibacillus rhizosphaerae]|uniref:DHA1 family multidrug resistance protein-like MFS transporter n=1 Tax=Paenibacillus rhizosphaerae TaxID=297318 RepID=A0A839TSJ4_9BACL|nr:MFS transporter [Paenibacillus rhizosphaerae]MBB3128269.1 DHA1 family multidrug resistance protein-like MFS transporter [Paenibacillus rhizosphaerae]